MGRRPQGGPEGGLAPAAPRDEVFDEARDQLARRGAQRERAEQRGVDEHEGREHLSKQALMFCGCEVCLRLYATVSWQVPPSASLRFGNRLFQSCSCASQSESA